jgi:hypothetical protein
VRRREDRIQPRRHHATLVYQHLDIRTVAVAAGDVGGQAIALRVVNELAIV